MVFQGVAAVQSTGVGVEDILNRIIWMDPVSDIVKTIIAAGPIIVIALVLFGVLQCFFGYKIFRYELAILGAAVCGIGTYVVLRFLLHYSGAKLIALTAFATLMGGGMLFTVSAIIVFILMVVGSTAFLLIYGNAQGWDILPEIIIVLSLAIGIISAILYKHVIIIWNALFGGTLIGLMMAGLFESNVFGLILGLVFGVGGLGVQYWMYLRDNRKKRRRQEEEDAAEDAKKAALTKKKAEATPTTQPSSGRTAMGGQPKVEENPAQRFPSQQELEQRMVLRDSGLKPSEIEERIARRNAQMAAAKEAAAKEAKETLVAEQLLKKEEATMPVSSITETGTISIGDLKSKMKKL